MEPKSGIKTTELIVLFAGLLTAIIPVVLDKIPPDSSWAVILGAILAAAVYISGRSYVKGKTAIASGLIEASKNGVNTTENP